MKMLRTIVVTGFGIVSIGAAPLAAADACKPVFDALDKVMTVPVHIYSTTKEEGKPKTMESIYTEQGIYSMNAGKWTLASMKRDEVAKQEEANRRKAKSVCRVLKDEAVNGEMATVYNLQTTGATKTEGQIWISKSEGVPLRHESDLLTGVKDALRTHYSVRYEYKNVVAPKVSEPPPPSK